MKKYIGIICGFIFVLLMVAGCGCKKNNKASLGVGDMNATTFVDISLEEVDAKVKADDTFILFVYAHDCDGCKYFKPILNAVIEEKNLIVYGIESSKITKGHALKSLRWTPGLVVYDKGDILVKTEGNESPDYFKDEAGFKTFLNKYTRMPTMYYISKAQLKEKINSGESFIIYYSRNDCGDCGYMYENYLKNYLYNNPDTNKFYVIETNAEGIRWVNGVAPGSGEEKDTPEQKAAAQQWQDFKDEFGLSNAINTTLGYGVGYVPTIQYYKDGEIKDMVVYFNDMFEAAGEAGVTIIESYFDDNPYLNKTIKYEKYDDYKNTLAPFYNEKMDEFFNNYLGLVD